jgi:hypothetical protein
VPESQVRSHLEPTQREAFDRALAWTASNPPIVEALRDRPDWLAGGAFGLEPVRGPIARWLHQRRLDRELRGRPAAARPALSADQKRRLEEARLLVDDVFGEE